MTKGAQEDVNLQRTQNNVLKNELIERQEIYLQIKQSEERLHNYSKEIENLKQQLKQTEDNLATLHNNYKAVSNNLSLTKTELNYSKEKEYQNIDTEKQLKQTLVDENKNRNTLLPRINELADHYEESIMRLNDEKENMLRKDTKRYKQIISVSIFQTLKKGMFNRIRLSLCRIKEMAYRRKTMSKMLLELAKIRDEYKSKVLHTKFSKWKYMSVNYVQEAKFNMKLVEKMQLRKATYSCFAKWRNSHYEKGRYIDNRLIGAKIILGSVLNIKQKSIRQLFHRWLQNTSLSSKRDCLLRKYLIRKDFLHKTEAIRKLSQNTKECKIIEQFKQFSDITTKTKFMRSIFMALREGVFIQEDEKVFSAQSKLNAFNNKRSKDLFAKVLLSVLLTKTKLMQNSLKEQAYNALNYNRVTEKKERANNKLNYYVAEFQRLDKEIVEMQNTQQQTKKFHLMKATITVFNHRLKYYLEKWYNAVVVRKADEERLAKLLLHWQKRDLTNGFRKWYNYLYRVKRKEKEKMEHQNVVRIQELLRNNIELDYTIEQHGNYMRRIILSKLQRIFNIIDRKNVKNKLKQWKEKVSFIKSCRVATELLEKTLIKHKLCMTMNKYREIVKLAKLESISIYKEKIIRNSIHRHSVIKAFYGMLMHTYQSKYNKEILKRKLTHLLHKKYDRWFNRWRSYGPDLTFESFKKENNQAIARIDDHKKEIEHNNERHNSIIEGLNRIARINKKKTELSLFKFTTVKEYTNLKIAMEHWRKYTTIHNLLMKILQRYIKKLHTNYLRIMFYNWRDFIYNSKIRDIKEKLSKERIKYNEKMKELAAKLSSISKIIHKVKQRVNECDDMNKRRRQQINYGLSILNRLKDSYVEMPLHGQCFVSWMNMYRREKSLQERFLTSIKQYTGKFIYRRFKWISLLYNRRKIFMKSIEYLMTLTKKTNIKYFMLKWRCEAKARKKLKVHLWCEKSDEESIKQNNQYNTIKDHSYMKYTEEFTRRKKLKLLQAFKKQTTFKRATNERVKKFRSVLIRTRITKLFLKWKNNTVHLLSLHHDENKAVHFYSENLKKKSLNQWKEQRSYRRTLPAILQKLSNRHYLNLIAHTFERLDDFAKSAEQFIGKQMTMGVSRMFYCLEKLYHKRIERILILLIIRGSERMVDKKTLKHVLIKWLNRKLKLPFNRWVQKIEEQKLVEYVETKGKIAQRAFGILTEHKTFAQLIRNASLEKKLKESLSNEEMQYTHKLTKNITKVAKLSSIRDNFENSNYFSLRKTLNRVNEQRNYKIERKFINMWIEHIEGTNVLRRYTNYWYNWLHKRKLIVTTSKYILKRLNNSEKSWIFHRLLNLKREALRNFSQLSRDVLINKISRDYNKIVELEEKKKHTEQLTTEYIRLNQKNVIIYNKGRKLVINTLSRYFRSSLYKAFMRWKRISEELVIDKLKCIVEEKTRGLTNLTEISRKLKEKNRILLVECGELRKSSLNGLEIASIVQEITREREQMSIDLADRSLTIKKLIEENRKLRLQLNIIQKANKKQLYTKN